MSLHTRLEQARSLRGLSLRKLAEKAGVSHEAIRKYECGADVPSSGVLLRLARALDVRVEYFLRSVTVGEIAPVFRKRKALAGPRLRKVEAEIRDLVERYLELEAIRRPEQAPVLDIPEGFPRPVRSMEDVEQAADDLRDAWQLGRDPIQNLTEILEERGVKVVSVAGDEKFDACTFELRVDGGLLHVIAVKADLAGDRHRFNLAHELAHLLLEVEDLDEEKAAHRFAGALLAPRERVLEELGGHRHSLHPYEFHALKHKYGLSMQAWVYRASDLGIVSEGTAKKLQVWFRKNRVHRVEPGEPLPAERPTRFLRMVLQAYEEGQIGRQRANELLGRPLDDALAEFAEEHPGLEAALGR